MSGLIDALFLSVCRLGPFPQQKSRISKVALLHAGQASGSKACTSNHSFYGIFPLHAWVTHKWQQAIHPVGHTYFVHLTTLF